MLYIWMWMGKEERTSIGLEVRLGAECDFSMCAVLFLFWLLFI